MKANNRRSFLRPGWVLSLVAVVVVLQVPVMQAQAPAQIQTAVDAAYAKYRGLHEGKNADYIPALAKVDPNLFGIAVVTPKSIRQVT